MLVRFQGRIEHVHLPRVSPMAVPVMLDIGREGVASASSAPDEILDSSAAALIDEAIGDETELSTSMDMDAMARALAANSKGNSSSNSRS
jgi:hypothetical protein